MCVLVPYRDRESHLEVFLNEVPKYLDTTGIDYSIKILEQTKDGLFNKGSLFNVGVSLNPNFNYYVLHDVDLIPEKVDYSYSRNPLCLLTHCKDHPLFTKPNFKSSVYHSGGVVLVSKEVYAKVNGFSNKFLGWGCEDDDFRGRLSRSGYKLNYRPNCWFRGLPHEHGKERESYLKNLLLLKGRRDYRLDGLNSVSYKINSSTNIKTNIDRILVAF